MKEFSKTKLNYLKSYTKNKENIKYCEIKNIDYIAINDLSSIIFFKDYKLDTQLKKDNKNQEIMENFFNLKFNNHLVRENIDILELKDLIIKDDNKRFSFDIKYAKRISNILGKSTINIVKYWQYNMWCYLLILEQKDGSFAILLPRIVY